MNDAERQATRRLAIGRILRLASRSVEPGDVAAYEDVRSAFLATFEAVPAVEHVHNYARDRNRGAQGD